MTGRLWPFPDRDGETGPVTRLWRKGILIPDLMVAFEKRGRRHRPARLPHVEPTWRPRVPGVGGRSRGNPRLAPGGADGEPARDEDAKGQWRHTRVILAPMWFPRGRTSSACGRVNPKLKGNARGTARTADPAGNLPRCHQPQKPDHAGRPKPGWAGSGGNGSTGAPASR